MADVIIMLINKMIMLANGILEVKLLALALSAYKQTVTGLSTAPFMIDYLLKVTVILLTLTPAVTHSNHLCVTVFCIQMLHRAHEAGPNNSHGSA